MLSRVSLRGRYLGFVVLMTKSFAVKISMETEDGKDVEFKNDVGNEPTSPILALEPGLSNIAR